MPKQEDEYSTLEFAGLVTMELGLDQVLGINKRRAWTRLSSPWRFIGKEIYVYVCACVSPLIPIGATKSQKKRENTNKAGFLLLWLSFYPSLS